MKKLENENQKQIAILSNCLEGIGQLSSKDEKKDAKKDEKPVPPKPENYVSPPLFESGEEPPVPGYVPPPPVPWDEDHMEQTPDDSKYFEEIAKGIALKKQREIEFQTMNEERKKTSNQFGEEAEKLQHELAKLQFKLKAAEDGQAKDLVLIKDK